MCVLFGCCDDSDAASRRVHTGAARALPQPMVVTRARSVVAFAGAIVTFPARLEKSCLVACATRRVALGTLAWDPCVGATAPVAT